MVLQYKQEFQNMNHEKPLLYHVFQLKFGQVYSVGHPLQLTIQCRCGQCLAKQQYIKKRLVVV
jgi:hypothetical protein